VKKRKAERWDLRKTLRGRGELLTRLPTRRFITRHSSLYFQGKHSCCLSVPDENKNPITGEYMLGEHLGSPLRFPLLEFVLLFHIFHQFYIGRGRPGCLPNLMPLPPIVNSPARRFITLTLTLTHHLISG